MKHVCALAALIIATAAAAEDVSESAPAPAIEQRTMIVGLRVSAMPLPSTMGSTTSGVAVEHAPTDHFSWSLGFNVAWAQLATVPGQSSNTGTLWSVGVEPAARWHFKGAAPGGVWVGPAFPLSRSFSGQWTNTTIGADVLLGYTALFDNGLSIQCWAGPSLRYGWNTTRPSGATEDVTSPTGASFAVRVGFGLGYSF